MAEEVKSQIASRTVQGSAANILAGLALVGVGTGIFTIEESQALQEAGLKVVVTSWGAAQAAAGFYAYFGRLWAEKKVSGFFKAKK